MAILTSYAVDRQQQATMVDIQQSDNDRQHCAVCHFEQDTIRKNLLQPEYCWPLSQYSAPART